MRIFCLSKMNRASMERVLCEIMMDTLVGAISGSTLIKLYRGENVNREVMV